jgi:hypothetical protein
LFESTTTHFIYSGTAVGETNIQGEDQKKLDVIANELFINMLRSSFEVSHTSTTPTFLLAMARGSSEEVRQGQKVTIG